MAKMAGKYYTDVASGNVFIGCTAAAGVAIPISTGTALTFGLWNTSATKNAALIQLTIGYTSGTITVGAFGLLNQFVGFTVGTVAPLAAMTAGTPKNALLGSGKTSSMTFIPATATLTTGGTACYWSGCDHEIATAGPGMSVATINLDGMIIVTPGQIVAVCDSIAQTGLFTMSLVWAEVDASG